MLTCLITHRGKTVVVVDGTKAGNVQGKDTSFLFRLWDAAISTASAYPIHPRNFKKLHAKMELMKRC